LPARWRAGGLPASGCSRQWPERHGRQSPCRWRGGAARGRRAANRGGQDGSLSHCGAGEVEASHCAPFCSSCHPSETPGNYSHPRSGSRPPEERVHNQLAGLATRLQLRLRHRLNHTFAPQKAAWLPPPAAAACCHTAVPGNKYNIAPEVTHLLGDLGGQLLHQGARRIASTPDTHSILHHLSSGQADGVLTDLDREESMDARGQGGRWGAGGT
jgi:hypothetical protein